MACNSKNGMTYIDTCIPVPEATAANATYVCEMTHYLCGNRKICINSAFPTTTSLSYIPQNIESVGNSVYNCDVLVTGTVTYMPYICGGNSCNMCPKTDNIWTTLSIPVTSSTLPTITAGIAKTSPANVKDCCSVTNAVSITSSFNVVSGETAQNNNG